MRLISKSRLTLGISLCKKRGREAFFIFHFFELSLQGLQSLCVGASAQRADPQDPPASVGGDGDPAGRLRPPAFPSQARVQATLKTHRGEHCQSCRHGLQKPHGAADGPAGACLRGAERPQALPDTQAPLGPGLQGARGSQTGSALGSGIWRCKEDRLGYFAVTRLGAAGGGDSGPIV